ncbi:hypothetical protein C6503_19430 [Candidatus Poribacteria bacterium]|nr:MAG: hypothetical protein C6503_19430 [Candidatus Poribacteria bacterium]
MRNIRTELRNVVELHKQDVLDHITSIPMTSEQIHAEIGVSFQSKSWTFDFTHKQVSKILSDLAWYGDIRSRTLYRNGNRTLYWRGIDYDWGRN